MAIEYEDEVLLCGSCSGENTNKFEKAKLTKDECEKIDCPKIKQALAYYECEVINEIEAGDHIIFVGKVLNGEENKIGKRIIDAGGRSFTTIR